MPRAVLFGYQGGLVDSGASRREALEATLADEGIPVSEDRLSALGPPYEAWLASVIASVRGRQDRDLAARLMARAAARYRVLLDERGPVWQPGVAAFIERAAAAGLDLGVVGAETRAEMNRALTEAALAARFKIVVGAEDLERPGSLTSGYAVALSLLNTVAPLPERLIHPHEVVAIEAAGDGLRAAVESGLLSVVVERAGVPSSAADVTVASFEELDLARLGSG